MSAFLWIFSFLIFCGFIIFSIRFAWWRSSVSYKYPRVLMYHMISDHLPKNKSKFNRLRVKPGIFEAQIAWLSKNNFKSFTLNELVNLKEIPPKSVVITFDDGYKDNFTNAFKILKKYNFKATIFIVLNRFNNDWATDKDLKQKSAELNAEKMLSNEEIREMLESRLIEIGSHTLNHANLPSLSSGKKSREIINSKAEIEKIFGIKCNSLAYPFGYFDDESLKIAGQNYAASVTTKNDVFRKEIYQNNEIPRIMISGKQGLLAFILKMKNGRVR
ncbi:MAG: polysaccharide deacetylase family protein [Campylobacter sp.]|nr:polysaccharide deacetylase family protein [Campylobacter sp.]